MLNSVNLFKFTSIPLKKNTFLFFILGHFFGPIYFNIQFFFSSPRCWNVAFTVNITRLASSKSLKHSFLLSVQKRLIGKHMYLVLILKTLCHLEKNLMKLKMKTSMIMMLWDFRRIELLKKLNSLSLYFLHSFINNFRKTCFFVWLRDLWNLWFCKLILYFCAKLNLTLYYGGYV